ncbi:MAG TPA: hypothetical protein VJT73_19765, partial [Polyangiaceae bacterium]|nr:hypothetical protein [Polyangiaceae bacterium]
SGDLPIGGNEDFRAQLPGKRESLKKRIPTVTIVMPADPPNATLTVDGHPLPPTVHGKPIPLNPGRHTVVVTAPDYAAFTSVANLNEGDALVANAVLGKVLRPALVSPLTSALAAPPAPRAAESGRGGSSRPYVLVGEALLTAGALAVGIGYTLAAVSADERLDEKKTELANRFPKPSQGPVMADGACNPPSLRDAAICSELLQAAADGKDNRFVARLGFIGAGAFASAFVGTMILWPSDRSKGATARVLPIALATPGFTGLSVAGRF